MPNEIPAIYQNENLLDSFLFKNKYDCFSICNLNSNCALVYYHDDKCLLYNNSQYLNLAPFKGQYYSLYNKNQEKVLVKKL